MTAEDRTEEAVLHPTHVEFLELRVLRGRTRATGVVGITEEATDVGIEIRIASQREAQSCRHLLAEHIPRGVHVAAPHIRAVVLLTCKGRARHNEDTLFLPHLTLGLIDATDGFQGEGITELTPGAASDGMGVVGLTGIEEIGISGVHPPSIGAIVIETLQVFPVNITGHGTESIIDLHARGIIHTWGPDMRESALWPCLDRQQKAFLIEFAELLCLRAETCPDGNHKMGMLGMDVLNQLRASGKVLREEIHSVPQIVGSPVLPVLDDAVEGHLQGTVLINDALRFRSTLIAFLRLPETVGPEGEHRHIAREVTHLGDDPIGRAAVHEVIVDAIACLRCKGHTIGIVIKLRG